MEKEKQIKKTFKDLQEIDGVVGQLYAKDATLQNSKLGYAYKRFVEKNYRPLLDELMEKLAIERVEYALTDEKTKEVLVDQTNPRGFKYDKEGLKKVMEAERKLTREFADREVVITPFISSYVPKGLNEEQTEVLKGLII